MNKITKQLQKEWTTYLEDDYPTETSVERKTLLRSPRRIQGSIIEFSDLPSNPKDISLRVGLGKAYETEQYHT